MPIPLRPLTRLPDPRRHSLSSNHHWKKTPPSSSSRHIQTSLYFSLSSSSFSLSPFSVAVSPITSPSDDLTHTSAPPAMAPRLFSCFSRRKSGLSPDNATADQASEERRRGGPVLVELFSSQGCATSPEAETLLSRLGRGDFQLEVPVIVMSFHVDYWDHLGWKDPFGSSICTVRQKAYVEALKLDTLYTPQAVVQGRAQCMGTEQEKIISAVRWADRLPGPTLQATFQRPTPDSLHISITGALRFKVDNKGADVMVALCENGLVTDCSKGENRGRVLSNDFVVRKLEKLCVVKDVSAKKPISGNVEFPLWDGFNGSKCAVVVFVQNSALHVFGSQLFQLPDDL